MINLNRNEKIVVIVGLSGTGKSTLSKQLSERYNDYHIIHTDHYLQFGDYGSQQAFNKLLRDVLEFRSSKLMIEGSLCYRLLRYGLENQIFFPDLIIMVVATEAERQRRRPDKDYTSMDRVYRTIWRDYLSISNPHAPRLVDYVGMEGDEVVHIEMKER